MSHWKAKLCALATPQTLRIVYVIVVVAALALAAGAPFAWGTGPACIWPLE